MSSLSTCHQINVIAICVWSSVLVFLKAREFHQMLHCNLKILLQLMLYNWTVNPMLRYTCLPKVIPKQCPSPSLVWGVKICKPIFLTIATYRTVYWNVGFYFITIQWKLLKSGGDKEIERWTVSYNIVTPIKVRIELKNIKQIVKIPIRINHPIKNYGQKMGLIARYCIFYRWFWKEKLVLHQFLLVLLLGINMHSIMLYTFFLQINVHVKHLTILMTAYCFLFPILFWNNMKS